MKRTRTKLADGRELLYFAADGENVSAPPDPRSLPPVSKSSQLRWDPLLDEWVMMASHRQNRTFMPARDCPPCPSRDGRQTEIPASVHRGDLREPLPQPVTKPTSKRWTCTIRRWPCDPVRPLRSGVFHQRSQRPLRRPHPRTGASGGGRLGRPHHGVVHTRRRRTDLLLRESGPRDRRHAVTSARADLRLSVRDPQDSADAGRRAPIPRTHGRDLHSDVVAAERRAGVRVPKPALRRSCPQPLAGRWSALPAPCPNDPELDDAERDDFRSAVLMLRRFDRLYDSRCRTSRHGTGSITDDEDLSYRIFSFFRCAARPTS